MRDIDAIDLETVLRGRVAGFSIREAKAEYPMTEVTEGLVHRGQETRMGQASGLLDSWAPCLERWCVPFWLRVTPRDQSPLRVALLFSSRQRVGLISQMRLLHQSLFGRMGSRLVV